MAQRNGKDVVLRGKENQEERGLTNILNAGQETFSSLNATH